MKKLLALEIRARVSRVIVAACSVLALAAMAGCDTEPATNVDADRGPIEATLTAADRVNWPGIDRGSGRHIVYTRSFAEGRSGGYWFLGFSQRQTADSFWFCREGDTACPLDEHHRLNWDRIVGHPIFMRIPGQPGFSPFWQLWTVRVPADFEADSVKTMETLHRLELAGEVSVTPEITDFGTLMGEVVGPQETIMHCALALAGTELDQNGDDMVDGSGPMLRMQLRQGWHAGYQVNFVDFSPTDGAFPAAADSESRPLMPMANVYIMWRSCDVPAGSPRPSICDLPGANPHRRSVSEFGAGQDFTGNRMANDTNNVFASLQCELRRASELRYSPSWKINFVMVNDNENVRLIDTYADNSRSDVQSADDVFARVESGQVQQPVPQREDETGNPVPGNDGQIFFNCPFSRAADTVPFPCE